MVQSDRILLITATDDAARFPLIWQRSDGARVEPQIAGPSSWVSAVRQHEWDFVVCQPALLCEHAFERGQREVLELIAAGAPLAAQLEHIVLLIEAQAPGMMCSILLLDRDRQTVHTGAAPHLPIEFVRAIEGEKIGPNAGSCGAAAFHNKLVIVEDIATHEYWADYRHLALPHGLRACWSSPIRSSGNEVLGTFAMYFKQPRAPGPMELHWVERATHIAAIAIERERAEAKQHLHSLVHDLITDVIFYLAVEPGQQYRFLSVNPAFTVATGLRPHEVVGRLVQEVIPEPALTVVLVHYAQAVAERRTVKWYEVSPYPAGVKHGLASITPILATDGHCNNLLGTVHDITELHMAHERIATLAALLDRAHDAILVWDVRGVIQYWNDGAERLYGWPCSDAQGQVVGPLIHDDPSQFEAALQSLMQNNVWRGELLQRTRMGKLLITEASWSLLRDEQGNPKSVLAIHTDITGRRELESQVFRAQRLESLGIMASGIAHDFNNILTAISANAGLASAAFDPNIAREALTQIEQASQRGAALVRQLFTFGRQREPKREPVELTQIVMEALSLVRTILPRNVEVRTAFAADVPRINADATQIHQVLVNLVTNAAHAMAASGGALDVRADRVVIDTPSAAQLGLHSGTYARLQVSDTGTGMGEATLERIFDPFFTTKGPGEGSGLGLAVVHGIVKSHQGAIVVHSTLGSGTVFEIYFPASTN
jgi:two-component system cell cycle sensor histidine kinase/response regulator CckA